MLVRTAEPADASALLPYLRHIDETSEFNVTQPGERTTTEDDLARDLALYAERPLRLALVAVDGDRLVGELTFKTHEHERLNHHGHFGVSVHASERGRGVGGALIGVLLDWAAAHPTIERVCLGVFAGNGAAIGLYRKLGFAEEYRKPHEFKLGPGRYMDDVQMARWVKPRPA